MVSTLDALGGGLDPDDPRQASQQIAARLRAAILDRKLAPGERLPSQPDLAARYGVARETVKRALDVLRSENLVVSRQGSGVFVRTQIQRAVELRPILESAFQNEIVSIDFAGISAETLRDALAETLDRVRTGDFLVQAVQIRLIVADTTKPMVIPALVDGKSDDPRLRNRLRRIVRRATDSILDQVHELAELGLLREGSVQVRAIATTPMMKLYIINARECFFGYYVVGSRPLTIQGEPVEIYDTLGKDVPLLHFSVSEDPAEPGNQFVAATTQWFESVWDSIAVQVEEPE